MKAGLHISIAGGIDKVPKRADDLGCECFQMFTRNPQGGAYDAKVQLDVLKRFKENCKKFKITDYYIHCPYYINLASSNNRIYYGSVNSIKKELEIADLIDAKAIVAHLGSAKDLSEKEAIKKVIKGVDFVLENYEGNAKLLIEISAGAGKVIGSSFDEIAEIIDGARKNKYIAVCFDTAHSFASGYDLRTAKRTKNVFAEFNKIIGLDKLELIHCNDSKSDLGSRIDRHENIGEGKIGIEGLQVVVDFAKARNLNIIAELENGKKNLDKLKDMRKK
ncbi:MAG: deoxyribonuclease IV [bacterium]